MEIDLEKNINREGIIWNAVAGLINACEAVVILMVITRTNGLADAGIVTIGFSIANLFVTIGKFGVRNFQVTDVKEKYGFMTYFYTRIITTLLMLISVCTYLAYCKIAKDYSINKVVIVFLICSIYVFEAVEDVFWGRYQQKGRLDIGAKIFSVRWCLTIGVFVLSAIITKNLLISVGSACATSLIFGTFLIYKTYSSFIDVREKSSISGIKELFKQSFPLFVATFLSFYIINAPKYAIDTYLLEEVQACYGFVSMPVFVIGMLNSFIYQPSLVNMGIEWQEKKWTAFISRIKRQVLIIGIITVICILGAYVCGIPILSLLYGTDLTSYKIELIILLFGGGMLALVGYMTVIITIMRKQMDLCWGYLVISVMALLITGPCVKRGGSLGAAGVYLLLISLLAGIFCALVIRRIGAECKNAVPGYKNIGTHKGRR